MSETQSIFQIASSLSDVGVIIAESAFSLFGPRKTCCGVFSGIREILAGTKATFTTKICISKIKFSTLVTSCCNTEYSVNHDLVVRSINSSLGREVMASEERSML